MTARCGATKTERYEMDGGACREGVLESRGPYGRSRSININQYQCLCVKPDVDGQILVNHTDIWRDDDNIGGPFWILENGAKQAQKLGDTLPAGMQST
jgi:hypothetical protein